MGIGEDVHLDNQSATGDIFTSDTLARTLLVPCAGCLPSSRCLLSNRHGRVTDRVLFTGTGRIKIPFIQ